MPKPPIAHARQIAFELLGEVDKKEQTLDYWLESRNMDLDRLKPADRALVHALVYGVLRWQVRLDWLIDRFCEKSPKKLDPAVRIGLRMGVFQLLHMDRIPPSAAVNTSVELIKHNGRRWAAGFVNGVLRRIERQRNTLPFAHNASDLDSLCVQYAFPPWLMARWLNRFGLEETRALCEHINTIPPLTLRANTLRVTRADLQESIQQEAYQITPTLHSPLGLRLVSPARPLIQWPAFSSGWFQVQDEAAQLASFVLAPLPGEKVWDACAGLGTKTSHLAQLMENRGKILAVDVHPQKIKRLQAEMDRLGVSIVQSRSLDVAQMENLGSLPLFDRILLDAPCSGLGVLRKNPDGKWRIQEKDLDRYARRQSILLDHAASRLRPGGRLVYAVCSIEPEETFEIVKGFLQNHSDFAIDPIRLPVEMRMDSLLTPEGFLRTLPHRHAMDGFFAAALIRL